MQTTSSIWIGHRRAMVLSNPRVGGPTGRARERGVAMVELCIVFTLLAFLVIGAIDIGRLASFQNRMENAAREGAAVAQMTPASVNSGCHGDRNVTDRAGRQNAGLAATSGYSVTVARKVSDASVAGGYRFVPYTGCGTTTVGPIQPGERIRVTVTADVKPTGMLTATFLGNTIHLSRDIEVVVQG